MTDSDKEASDEKPAKRRRSRRRGKRGGKERTENVEAVAGGDEADFGEDSEEDQAEESKDASKHRKIPTWGEAIAVVVNANIESRGQAGSSKPARGRRGQTKAKPKR